MKLLLLSKSNWDDTNSFGNTMTNFFGGWDTDKIAHIYCRSAEPSNSVCREYFSISEKDFLKSLLNKQSKPGHLFFHENRENAIPDNGALKSEEKIYSFFRQNRSVLAKWGQELLWKLGLWKRGELDLFLSDYKPDIVFAPAFSPFFMHDLLWYIKEKSGAKVVLFHADDYLSINTDGSILSFINKSIRSKVVTQSALKADLNYCISPKQQLEYEKKINREMRLLYKGADFLSQPPYEVYNNRDPKLIRIVYTGSLFYGRWKTLSMLAKTIQEINKIKPVYELLIYSQYQPSIRVKKEMVIEGVSKFMGKVPAEQVPIIMNESDIVLHVESFDEKEKYNTRLSFSTKIVDCLNSGRAVMAIGWNEAASIDYFIINDAAIVASDREELLTQLKKIADKPSLLKEYADKAWACGKKNHQIENIQKMLYNDFKKLLDNHQIK